MTLLSLICENTTISHLSYKGNAKILRPLNLLFTLVMSIFTIDPLEIPNEMTICHTRTCAYRILLLISLYVLPLLMPPIMTIQSVLSSFLFHFL